MNKRVSWGEAMIRNTEYLSWGKKKYKKKFLHPDQVDTHRAILGKEKRPARFRV